VECGIRELLNLDTHIVVHLMIGQLTPKETDVLAGREIGISTMVLWELAKLKQLGRISVGLEDFRLSAFLRKCRVWQIDAKIAIASTDLDFRSDPADELIAATSIVHKVPLLTRDAKILASKLVPLALS
jgi:PIN domain nuclease of toxin-antitoxin system